MRILAIDLGNRRVGLALSDPSGVVATPLTALDRKKPHWRDDLYRLIADNQVGEIVVGYPKNMDGSVGGQAQRCEKFAQELEQAGHTVHLLDERLTSVAASAALRESGRRSEKGAVDAVAASLILQVFLERRRREAG